MGYVNFKGYEKCIDTILKIAYDVYGIEGTGVRLKIPTPSYTMPYFISSCQLYFEDDDPNMYKTLETILNLTYNIHGEEVFALIYKEEANSYVRTISIDSYEGNDYAYSGRLVFCSHSFDNLVNIKIPSGLIKWQIYEGLFKEGA